MTGPLTNPWPIYSYFERLSEKSALDNPERYCGWFWVHRSSEYLKEWHERSRPGRIFASAIKKSNKSRFDSTATVVRNSVLIISILPFRIVVCTFFPTTFLEIAVFSAGHLSWSRGSPLSWGINSVPVTYSVWAQEKLVLAMNRLL